MKNDGKRNNRVVRPDKGRFDDKVIGGIGISKREIQKLIGTRLQQERNKKGMTQQNLADEIESSYGHISEIERGLVDPGITILYHICLVLDITLNELLQGQRLSDGTPSGFSEKMKKLTKEQQNAVFALIEYYDNVNKGKKE